MKLRLLAAAGIAAAVVLLSACSGTASDGPSSVIAPVTMSAGDLQGATVQLVVGQVLNIDTGDLAVDSYTGKVADTRVATFVAGRDDGSAQFNPGVDAVAVGETGVTMTNRNGGIQPLEFTVVVTAK